MPKPHKPSESISPISQDDRILDTLDVLVWECSDCVRYVNSILHDHIEYDFGEFCDCIWVGYPDADEMPYVLHMSQCG